MDTNPAPNTPPPAPPFSPAAAAGEDKTVAILSYITLIGFIIAIIMHGSKKTALGSFHLRQALGLVITSIVGWIALMIVGIILAFIPFIGWALSALLWLAFVVGLLVLAIMGLISAANGEMKPLPVVGELYQKWFGNAFA